MPDTRNKETTHNPDVWRRAKYRPEIDGVRALAICAVVLFHASVNGFNGGFIGVDIFFVISGFLICGNINADLESGSFSFKKFYERRARRILPALAVVVSLSSVAAWFWLLPDDLRVYSTALFSIGTYASNILFARANGYFDASEGLRPLLHTWSLGLEEQFYFIFPLFWVWLWRRDSRRRLTWLVSISVASLCVAIVMVRYNARVAFYWLPFRWWELAIGAICATCDQRSNISANVRRYMSETIAVGGLCLMIGSVACFNRSTLHPSLWTLLPTAGTAAVLLFAKSGTFVGRLLSFKPLVAIGLLSYSFYLWHQPILDLAEYRLVRYLKPSEVLVLLCATFVVSALTWWFVERPFRDRDRVSRRMIVALAVCCTFGGVLTGASGYLLKGFPGRLPVGVRPEGAVFPSSAHGGHFYDVQSDGNLSVGSGGTKGWCGDPSGEVVGVLFGDSHAAQYEPLWNMVGEQLGCRLNVITSNWGYPSLDDGFTGPSRGRAYEQAVFNREYIRKELQRYSFIVLGGDWTTIAKQGKLAGVRKFIEYASSRCPIVLVMAAPKIYDVDVMSAYCRSVWYGKRFDSELVPSVRDAAARAVNRTLEGFCTKFPNVIFIDRKSVFGDGDCYVDAERRLVPYSLDGSHISLAGAEHAAVVFMGSHIYADIVSRVHALPPGYSRKLTRR